MQIIKVVLAVFIFCLSQIFVAQAQGLGASGEPRGNGTTVLKAALLIDGTGAAPIKNGVIVIKDNKIAAVGTFATIKIPGDAKVVDLGNATLMPGFIDAHTHIIGRVLGDPEGQNAQVS